MISTTYHNRDISGLKSRWYWNLRQLRWISIVLVRAAIFGAFSICTNTKVNATDELSKPFQISIAFELIATAGFETVCWTSTAGLVLTQAMWLHFTHNWSPLTEDDIFLTAAHWKGKFIRTPAGPKGWKVLIKYNLVKALSLSCWEHSDSSWLLPKAEKACCALWRVGRADTSCRNNLRKFIHIHI